MYSIKNFRAFNVRCFSDPRTFFNSELLSIYGRLSWYSLPQGTNETSKVYVDKFYKVLNVNNDSLIAMCVVLEGLAANRLYMAKGNYIGLATVRDLRRLGSLGDYGRIKDYTARLTRKLLETIS